MTKQSVIRFVAVVAAVCAGIAGYNFWVQKQIAAQVSEMQQPVNEKFDQNVLIAKAQKLASKDYEKPADILPQELKNLDYDKHRDIRFVRENGPWYGKKLPFELQFFHLGSIFQISVPINEVVNGKATRIKYSPQFFDYGRNKLTETAYDNLCYAGFRLHTRLNSPAYYDELLTVRIMLKELPTARINFFYEIYNEKGDLLNTGMTQLGFIHSDTRRPCRVPDWFLQLVTNKWTEE